MKRGAEFISSRSQCRTSRAKNCILMHSANRQEGIPPTVHSVCICLRRLKARVGCNQVRLGPCEARHCTTRIKECVRANDLVGSFKVTKTVAIALHPCEAKFQYTRVLARSLHAWMSIEGQMGATRGIIASQLYGASTLA